MTRGAASPGLRYASAVRKRKRPKTYRYDSSLSPALDWDGQKHARELGEWLLAQIEDASRLDPPHVSAHRFESG
jgi:adenine-specific DNA-methyltransferase